MCVLLLSGGIAIAAAPARPASNDSLSGRIANLLAAKGLAGMKVGVRIESLAPQRSLVFEQNSQDAFKPASNQKLITSSAAMTVLSPGFTYRTLLALRGDDLVIIGAGDPSVGDPRMAQAADEPITTVFRRWAEALKAKGVTEIRGNLLFDDFIFEQEHLHPGWRKQFDLQDWYAAPVGGLNFNDNCVDVLIKPAADKGQPAIVTFLPTTPYVRLENRTKTAAKGEPIINRSSVDPPTILVSGSVSKGNAPEDAPSISVPDPGVFFASACRTVLASQGIRIAGETRRERVRSAAGSLPPDLKVVATHDRKMIDLMWRVNKSSLNMFAEALLKTMGAYAGREKAPGVGSYETGRAVVRDFLDKVGISRDTYVLDDGSGLSHDNRVTPAMLTSILAYMDRHPRREEWLKNLAAPGEKVGTLRKRMKDLDGRVFAKTGTIGGVSSLSGYIKGPAGRWYAFSVLCNDTNKAKGGTGAATQLQDEICRTLATWGATSASKGG